MNANITLAQEWIAQADAILIGASNGLSIAEGYHIFANNEMFRSSLATCSSNMVSEILWKVFTFSILLLKHA